MKIVLDTNVLVSGIFWGGIPFRILEHWISDDIEIIATPDILNEYVRVISFVGKKQAELMTPKRGQRPLVISPAPGQLSHKAMPEYSPS